MRFVFPIKFANQLRSKNLFLKMNQFRTTQLNLLLPNTLKSPELISQTYGLIHTNGGGGGKFPTKEEKKRRFSPPRTKEDKRKILIEMAKDGWPAVGKKYNVPPLVLHEWRKEFTPEELGLAPE